MNKILYLLLLLFFTGCSLRPTTTTIYSNTPNTTQTYNLTSDEIAMFNSIVGQEFEWFNKSFDTNGDESLMFFQQTVDINTLEVGDSVTINYNTLNVVHY